MIHLIASILLASFIASASLWAAQAEGEVPRDHVDDWGGALRQLASR